jgi:group I intron endonuclease
MAIVYLHRRKDNNEVFYVGIGKNKSRAYCKHKRNQYWYKVVNKYGYKVDITHNDLLYEDCTRIEIYLIDFWRKNSINKLCNITDGGEGTLGYKFSETTKQKISESQKIRLSNKLNHHLYGKKHTKESIEKNRESNRGEKSFFYGKKGILHPRYGKKISQEQKNIIADSNKSRAKLTKEIVDELIKQYIPRKVSFMELSKRYGVSFSAVSAAIKKRKNEIYDRREANYTKVCLEGVA